MTVYYVKQDNTIWGCGDPGCCGEYYEEIDEEFVDCSWVQLAYRVMRIDPLLVCAAKEHRIFAKVVFAWSVIERLHGCEYPVWVVLNS